MTTNDGCRADVRKARAEATQPDPTAAAIRAAQAEALREAAEEIVWRGMQSQGDWLRDRADRLATDTAAPEGRLASAGTYQHDDDTECLWGTSDQTWYQMHPLYPLRECRRPHETPAGGHAPVAPVSGDGSEREVPAVPPAGLTAAPVAVEGVETVRTEYAVMDDDGTVTETQWRGVESDRVPWNRETALRAQGHIKNWTAVTRTITTRVSEWTPIKPETSEPEGGESR